MDTGCYTINILRHLMGEEPEVLSARVKRASPEIDRYMEAELQFPGGVDIFDVHFGDGTVGIRFSKSDWNVGLDNHRKSSDSPCFIPSLKSEQSNHKWNGTILGTEYL